jgi:putative transcriptional regulator
MMSVQKLKTGLFLLANDSLQGSVFENSVILLLNFSEEEGAYGIIINQNSHIPLNEVFSGLPKNDWLPQPFFLGGPVEDSQIQMIQLKGNLCDAPNEFLPGLFLGGKIEDKLDSIERLIFSPNTRLVLGYSGWGPGQLEQEIKDDAWSLYQTDVRTVLSCPIDELALSPRQFCEKFEAIGA